MIVQRKTQEAAEATRSALPRTALRKRKTLDPRSLIVADFMILATSLSKSGYSTKAILAAYRLRWQIDLASKCPKALLQIDQLPIGPSADRDFGSMPTSSLPRRDDLGQNFLDSSP